MWRQSRCCSYCLARSGAVEASTSVFVIHKTSQWLVNIAWFKLSSCHSHRGLMSLLHDAIYYSLRDVSAQMSMRNRHLSSATILLVSLYQICLSPFFPVGFSLLRFHATIHYIIVFSKPLCRVKWPNHLIYSTILYIVAHYIYTGEERLIRAP